MIFFWDNSRRLQTVDYCYKSEKIKWSWICFWLHLLVWASLMAFIIYLCQGDMGTCVICSAIRIRFWFRLREQMPSVTLNPRVLCGRRCTSPSLVLFHIIFDRFFSFKYLLWNFWFEFASQTTCSTLIWTSSKSNLKFAWWNTLQDSQLILQSNTFCWKVALVQTLLLHWAIRSSHRRCSVKRLFLKILQISQEKPVLQPSSLQLY